MIPVTLEAISSHAARSGFASSLIAITSPTMANMAQTEEMKSQCLSGLVIFGGATASVAIRVTMTTGTLMRNTDPHQKNFRSCLLSLGFVAADTQDREVLVVMVWLGWGCLVVVVWLRVG